MTPTDGPKDVVLVQKALDGDLSAFETLYHRYSTSVFRTIQAVVKDRLTAEDVLQECFVRAYRNLHRVDQTVESLAPWLHRIGLNLSYNKVSRKKPFLLRLDMVTNILESPRLSPDRLVEQDEVRRALWDGIAKLDDKYRVVVVLYYLEELKLKEIAERLDIPKGTVKSRLFYARKALRHLLSDDRRVAHLVTLYGTGT
ncbi:MAG: RNA polymerase sigma factor [Ardenticatenaceae bacterium]